MPNTEKPTGSARLELVEGVHLLRRSFREDGKVRNETVANLSHLPAGSIDVLRKSLAGKTLVEAGADITITRHSRPDPAPPGHPRLQIGRYRLPRSRPPLLQDQL